MAPSNRQDIPGELWVVATPIGNLEDLSARAKDALGRADRILCEDTRRTWALLSAVGIQGAKLERMDAHATERKIEWAVEAMRGGENLALVSDAGTPSVSDPGAALVKRTSEAGVRVVPIPGASAVTAFLSASGLLETEFAFLGFFPRKASEREKLLEGLKAQGVFRVAVFFESPERIEGAIQWLTDQSPDLELVLGKELTKLHEKFFRGSVSQVSDQLRQEIQREGSRGEWVFALRLPDAAKTSEDILRNEAWVLALRAMLDAKLAPSEASRRISQHFGVARQRVYDQALRLQGKK